MAAQGLEVFDKTLQTTHIWLNEIGERFVPDKHLAWRALGAVTRTLRDRLPMELAAHLAAELPLLVRGAYYDQFRPRLLPTDLNDVDAFADSVAEAMADTRVEDPKAAMSAVFATLSAHIPRGQIRQIQRALPITLSEFWREAESDVALPN